MNFRALSFLLVVIFVGFQIWTSNKEAKASQDWPSTTGQLIEAHVKEVQRNDYHLPIIYSYSRTYYTVTVKYEYKVNGNVYRGDRISINSPSFSTEALAQKKLDELQKLSSMTVYYNPADPKKSTLTR